MSHSQSGTIELFPSIFIPVIITAAAFALYLYATLSSNKRFQRWPMYRYGCFIIGVLSSASAVTGPLADWAHLDFRAHMLGHLLLGMLGPLLIVLSSPVALALRTMEVHWARSVTRLLKSKPVLWISHPITAATLNIGGLWLIYGAGLYSAMQHNMLIHILVHFHVFVAGYLFTASLIYTDLAPHRTSYNLRSFVMIIAFAGHGILSKLIYAEPPEGIPQAQGLTGGLLMYYGGDLIDLVLIFIFWLQWYRSSQSLFSKFSMTR
ncbi:cytochrome c oxidase assembly protein [Paenibacillus antarcticus]|nr:cytochrome c oxidase assembly protein [Paenibacillus antarcticus]